MCDYDPFQAIMNDINNINNIVNEINDILNNIMNDIVNDKNGLCIVNDINDKKVTLLISQTAYLLAKLFGTSFAHVTVIFLCCKYRS